MFLLLMVALVLQPNILFALDDVAGDKQFCVIPFETFLNRGKLCSIYLKRYD